MKLPLARNVDVAVEPNCAELAEKSVDDAKPLNDCSAVQMFALARLSEYVPLVPPICDPAVPEKRRDVPLAPILVVATLAKVFTPEKYGMLPTTADDDVERPVKEIALPVTEIGNVEVKAVR